MPPVTKPRVLIVDDEPETIRGLTLGLRSRGYPVEAAFNAAEAIRLLGDPSRFGMVVTDYSMPGINGIEFLGVVRAGCGPLPVILMTAYGNTDVLVDALRNNCDGFIEKPFTVEEIITEIERVLHGRADSRWP